MENTKNGPQAALARVPKISGRSPLAEGFTVNIRDARDAPDRDDIATEAIAGGKPWHLRVWSQGSPVESSYHPKPSAAATRLAALVMNGTVGARLRDLAAEAAGDLFRQAGMGGFGGGNDGQG